MRINYSFIRERCLFLSSFLIYLAVRLVGLGGDILNSDGARWYRRSSNFLSALTNGNYFETYQHYHPGVTLMWIRALVEDGTWWVQDLFKMHHWYMENYAYFLHIHALTKTILVLVLFSLFMYQVVLVRKLFGVKVAVIFSFMVAVEPYLAGIDRWFHLTSLDAYFSFTAFLTVLYWAKVSAGNRKGWRLLALSGVLLALSVLSKVTGLITFAPILLVILINYWRCEGVKQKRFLLLNVSILVMFFITTVFALFPALWQNSTFVFGKVFSAVGDASNLGGAHLMITTIRGFSYYPMVLLFKLSPVTVILFISGCLFALKKRKLFLTPNLCNVLVYLAIYYLLLSIASKKIDRYSVEFILPILLLVSAFLSKIGKRALAVTSIGILVVCVYIGINNFPVLSGFYSPIAGREDQAIKLGIYDNSGEYFAQAAFYLNKYDTKKIYIPNNFEPFKFFSKHEIVFEQKGADYALFSLDSLRHEAPEVFCGPLEKTFGPRFEQPVVYVYRCGI